jgi:GTPase SAR1 family protein
MRMVRGTFTGALNGGPTIEDSYHNSFCYEDFRIDLNVLDSAGDSTYRMLRPDYIATNSCFVICDTMERANSLACVDKCAKKFSL